MAKTETETVAESAKEQSKNSTATKPTKPAAATSVSLVDIEALGKDLPAWKMRGIATMMNWKPGKQVSEAEFNAAVAKFENRPIGSGR